MRDKIYFNTVKIPKNAKQDKYYMTTTIRELHAGSEQHFDLQFVQDHKELINEHMAVALDPKN